VQFQKSDKTQCDNLIRLLKRAKIELEGAEEILGTAEILKWVSSLAGRIDKDLKDQEISQKAAEAIVKSSPILDPAAAMTLPSPVQPKPTKSRRTKKSE
jgi:hypothetical protein